MGFDKKADIIIGKERRNRRSFRKYANGRYDSYGTVKGWNQARDTENCKWNETGGGRYQRRYGG